MDSLLVFLSEVLALGNEQTVVGSINTNQWAYYSFNVTGSFATVSLLEEETWARGYYWYTP